LPLIYSYQTTVSNKEEFLPKTIKQFSSFVEQNSINIKTPGTNGVQVAVVKTILSGDDVLETINISEDFYPPVHKVEIHPLTVTAPAEGTVDGTTDGTGTGSPTDGTTGSTDGTTGTTDGSGTSTDGSTDQPSTDTGNGTSGSGDGSTGSGTSTGGSGSGTNSGNENNNDDTEPEYDKGGNVIPPSK